MSLDGGALAGDALSCDALVEDALLESLEGYVGATYWLLLCYL